MITLVCFIFFLSSHLECNLIVQVNEVHMIVYELAIFFHYLTELKTTFNTHQQLILTHESDCIPFVFHCSSTYTFISYITMKFLAQLSASFYLSTGKSAKLSVAYQTQISTPSSTLHIEITDPHLNQKFCCASLTRGMPSIRHNVQCDFRPNLQQNQSIHQQPICTLANPTNLLECISCGGLMTSISKGKGNT